MAISACGHSDTLKSFPGPSSGAVSSVSEHFGLIESHPSSFKRNDPHLQLGFLACLLSLEV